METPYILRTSLCLILLIGQTACAVRRHEKATNEFLTATQVARFNKLALEAGLPNAEKAVAVRSQDGGLHVSVFSREQLRGDKYHFLEALINKPYGSSIFHVQCLQPMKVIMILERTETRVPMKGGELRVRHHDSIDVPIAQEIAAALWLRAFVFDHSIPEKHQAGVLEALNTLPERRVWSLTKEDNGIRVGFEHCFIYPMLKKRHGRWVVISVGWSTD